LRFSKDGFVANGDISLEFALPNPNQEVTAWAYEPGSDEVSAERTALASTTDGSGAPAALSPSGPVGAPFVAVALRPKLPRTAGAVRHAREALRGAPNGSGRIVYIGDGTPTVGAVQPAFLRREIEAAVPRDFGTVTTVAVGTDADVASLRTLAESAGGVMVPYA